MASIKRKRSDASDHSVPPDDVAQDFKDALQDLSNDRYQITNLTVIAKESTEHAMAISDVLLNHIAMASPTRKLPALYVLDSIVKNVGTPYTDFLTRNLFKTYMDAYTLVDQQTRKQMENMLKTWKEAVPGSMDQQPVFPIETTRPIENALIRARTMVLEQQKQQGFQPARSPFPAQNSLPPRPTIPQATQTWRDTSTPSQSNQYNPPPTTYYSPPPYQAAQQPTPQMQSITPNYLSQYHTQTYPQQPTPQPYSTPQPHPQVPHQYTPQPFEQPYSSQATGTYAPPQNGYSLAALLQGTGGFPQQQHTVPQPPPPPPPPAEAVPQLSQFHGLEALFRHAKPAGHVPLPTYDRVPTPQPPTSTSTPVQSKLFTPPVIPATLVRPLAEIKNDVQLTSASLKIPRPALVENLYSQRPSQCTTCGRRFPATAEGKARKSRHLDAHFRTNMKFSQQEIQGGKGVSRSWYVGEVDWIHATEYDDADEPVASATAANASTTLTGKGAGTEGGGTTGAAGGETAPQRSLSERYIKAPVDAAMATNTCPICQDEFNAVWHDEAQEWVWMDAVRVNGKVYHGSCLGEMAKDREGFGGTSTAPTSTVATGAKSKVESVMP